MSSENRHTVIKDTKELDVFARRFVKVHILGRQRRHAAVVALFGDLGAGKTSFTQRAARVLGVKDAVISPTFVIERVYRVRRKPFTRFVHIDCYRLKSGKELLHLGWKELIADPENVIFVEWAERIRRIVPEDALKIYFEHRKTGGRNARVTEPVRTEAKNTKRKAQKHESTKT